MKANRGGETPAAMASSSRDEDQAHDASRHHEAQQHDARHRARRPPAGGEPDHCPGDPAEEREQEVEVARLGEALDDEGQDGADRHGERQQDRADPEVQNADDGQGPDPPPVPPYRALIQHCRHRAIFDQPHVGGKDAM